MSLEQLKKDVCAAVDGLAEELLALSHAIHGEPELALEEFKAAKRLTDAVEGHGIAVQREAFGLKTGYAAEFGKDGGPNIAILSEYDALPGIGHACGHNIIATSGYGAAIALSKLNGRLPGRVRYLGTPAEERFGGKEIMAREGAFDGTDAAMMIHPSSENLVTMPCIAIAEVEAIFHGRSAHASAMPYRGLNALDAVVTAYQAIAQLRQHIRNTDRIHGIITEGGLAPNIVPERAACRFYVRAVDAHELAPLKARVHRCLEAGALATGCTLEAHWGDTRLSRPQDQLADGRAVREERGQAGARLLPGEGFAAGLCRLDRHGQCQPSRALDPSDAGRRAGRRDHPQRGIRPLCRVGNRRRGGDRRRQIARHDGARPDGRRGAARGGARRFRRDGRAFASRDRAVARALEARPSRAWRLRLRMSTWLLVAAINGALAAAAGAFGAHGLQGRIDAHALQIFETAARYHMYHALAIGLAAFAIRDAAAGAAATACAFFLAGFFSSPVRSIFWP
ncbi:MAG: amidohydrolase [Rhizomicrobium sp.]